jgi:RHS repeat-associated protein
MSIHSHLPFEQSTSHARIPAGGIDLIASIDSVSEAQFTASFFGSTKALHGEVATTSPATTTHNHRNQQYSITAVTTSSGAIAERYAYSAYGEPTICDSSGSAIGSSSAINNRYSYTGREWDGTVGLYHFRARWMCPKTGRFLTRDPIGYHDGMCQYQIYFDLATLDPMGLSECTVTKDSYKTSIFGEDDRNQINGNKPSLDGFAQFLGRLRKSMPLPEIDFQIDVSWQTKACLEKCECNRTAMHFTEDYKFQFKFAMKGARIPVAAVPGTWIGISGDVRIDQAIRTRRGGCKNENDRELCMYVGGKVEFSYCGGVPSTLQGCIKGTLDCQGGGCVKVSSGKNETGCKWKISAEGCLGPLCRNIDLATGSLL